MNKLLPIPGVAENAHGFRGIAEALFLRDHITRQLELAAITSDRDERDARCTFVVVGAGYTGTEVAAQGQLFTRRLADQLPALAGQRIRWLLADVAPRLLPELNPRLSRIANRVLRRRGVEVRTKQSVERAGTETVRLTTGEDVATRAVTRGYHLFALPGNRTRTAADWAINTVMPPRAVQLGLVGAERVRLDCTES